MLGRHYDRRLARRDASTLRSLRALSAEAFALTMPTRTTTEDFYISGGTLPTSALSYVRRSADEVLYQALLGCVRAK